MVEELRRKTTPYSHIHLLHESNTQTQNNLSQSQIITKPVYTLLTFRTLLPALLVMSRQMLVQLHLSDEPLVAHRALVRLVHRVGEHMPGQHIVPAELLLAHVTMVRLDLQMDDQMLVQVVRVLEPLVANGALARLLAGVDAVVPLQVAELAELLAALVALEPFLRRRLRL